MTLLLQLFISIFISYILVLTQFSTQIELTVNGLESEKQNIQIFWSNSSTKEFNETDSKSFALNSYKNIHRFDIPSDIRSIRIDPLNSHGTILIESLCIKFGFIPHQCLKSHQDFTEAKYIHNVSIKPDRLFSAEGPDPFLVYSLDKKLIQYFTDAEIIVIALLTLSFFIFQRFFLFPHMKKNGPNFGYVVLFVVFGYLVWMAWAEFQRLKYDRVKVFTGGEGANVNEHLYDQFGQSISDGPGNFIVVIDPFTSFKNFPNQNVFGITTDQNGFRGSNVSPGGKLSGLILGGSTAFGWRLKNDAHTLDALLAQRTNTHFVNMALVSAVISQELSSLVMYGLDFKPKYIVSLSGWNDFVANIYTKDQKRIGGSSNYENLENRLRELKTSQRTADNSVELAPIKNLTQRLSVQKLTALYISYLDKLNRISTAAGAEFILVFQTDAVFKEKRLGFEQEALDKWLETEKTNNINFEKDYFEFASLVEDYCLKNQIKFVNLVTAKSIIKSEEVLFSDRVHLTPRGYEIVVDEILSRYRIQ